ncbi:hypothetical protein T4C_366 [Trichinella pseudospiralis]|uniref:Uncharacterized protein n=1 Tax=Trichinella pseudospiralis TaxID=6337 RepID=A0A0V1KA69_TRIPS|nr:hypothetical protein T4C_366 [Trichinella pseudospiralis]
MADFSEQRLVPTRSNSISLVCERRAYKLRQRRLRKCNVDGFKSDGRDRKLSKKPSGKETKPIPAIYDEEASNSSSEQSISGQLYHNGINSFLPSMPLWLCGLYVYCLCTRKDIDAYGFILSKSNTNGNPQTRISAFETALIPLC